MSRRRLLVLALVAILGIAGGVVTALLAPGRAEGPGTATTDFNDPLRLGIPLVSLPCTGEAVLVLGSGDTAAALTAAVTGAPDDVRYLRTDESCETIWASDEGDPPRYIAYLGPAADETAPCEVRMDGDHARDDVTNLNEGTAEFVNCVCVLPSSAAPVVEPPAAGGEATADPATVTWVVTLQEMLADLDREADSAPAALEPDGVYGTETARRIRQLQSANQLAPAGVVDDATWQAVQDATCGLYDY